MHTVDVVFLEAGRLRVGLQRRLPQCRSCRGVVRLCRCRCGEAVVVLSVVVTRVLVKSLICLVELVHHLLRRCLVRPFYCSCVNEEDLLYW